jgi:bacteriocin-like protein
MQKYIEILNNNELENINGGDLGFTLALWLAILAGAAYLVNNDKEVKNGYNAGCADAANQLS